MTVGHEVASWLTRMEHQGPRGMASVTQPGKRLGMQAGCGNLQCHLREFYTGGEGFPLRSVDSSVNRASHKTHTSELSRLRSERAGPSQVK